MDEEINLEGLQNANFDLIPTDIEVEMPDTGESTDTPTPQPEQVQQPSTEGQTEQFKIPTQASTYDDPSLGGIVKGTALGMAETAAPLVGISDTFIDTANFAKGFFPNTLDKLPDIPKIPEYESNTTQALRNISGLVIPSLGLRGMLLKQGARIHAAKTAPKFLQNLGNTRSFQYFAKFGADVGTGGLVDYVAEQNQKDDNLAGTLKKFWPKMFQWLPESITTGPDDSAGDKRAKNVNEGAIFGLLASIVEGVAYLTKAGRSMQRTAKFVPTTDSKTSAKKLKELTEDEFTNVKFSDKPVEDSVLRGFARKEKELNDLSEYYISRGQEPPNWPDLDEVEKFVRTKDADSVAGAAADAAQIQNNIESAVSYTHLTLPTKA